VEPPLSRRPSLHPIARALTALQTEDTPEARVFLQARLAFFLKLISALSGGFFALGLTITAVAFPEQLEGHLSHPATISHVTATIVMLSMWLYVGGPPRSSRALDVVDALGVSLLGLEYAFMTTGRHDGEQAELVPLLAVGWTLVARAALVPSPALRTAVLGIAASAPLIFFTYFTADDAPVMRSVYAGFWTTTAVVTTTVVSRTIYGLRRQVRQAMKVGQYTLVESIGEGGMGVVYRAEHALLRRPTAIKLLPPDKAGAAHIARFEREVQVTSRLTHPNTVAIYDFGRTPEGVFYYAMEYLDGLTLEHLVKAHGPLPPARAIHLVTQICGALREAHASDVVHRDVKPANVIVTVRGGVPDVVKVLDFGLVKVASEGSTDISGSNVITGTPLYMAPEAIADPDSIDARADIYAVGATLFFLLTGSTVFSGKTLIEICSKHLHEAPVAPSERAGQPFPPELDALVLRCLSKAADDRPRSVADVAQALGTVDAEPWTTTMAEVWWNEHGTELKTRVRAERAVVASAPRTMTVDLARDGRQQNA
jgi:serine/threonine-protein kinase